MHSLILTSLVVVLVGLILFPSQAFSANVTPKIDFEKIKLLKEKFKELKTEVDKKNSIPIIIGLDTDFVPEGKLTRSDVKVQKNKIGQDQDSLLSFLKNYRAEKIKRFEHFPFIAMTVDKATLQRLEASPQVSVIAEDILFKPLLADSVPLIGAPFAWSRGFSGQGQAVAVLDTGVDKNHFFLLGKVVSEACYSTNDPGISSSVCPGGVPATTDPNSALPCSINGCGHGTHVAGIAAGDGVNIDGVAKDASIIAIQVFSEFLTQSDCGGTPPCILAYTSDIVLGLDRVNTLASTLAISSVNLSLGGGSYNTEADCDADPSNFFIKQSVDSLRSKGIATVAAAGNDFSSNSLNTPACISSVVSVGSTTKTDSISSFSNIASFLDLLAPGSAITSSIPGNNFAEISGTSMATPHVAGAWAVLKSAKPTATVDEVLDSLQSTGKPVSRNGVLFFPRIKVDSAVNDLVPPPGVPWFDPSWQFRKQITIDHTKVAATLTDFPALVSITDANLLASAQADGDDILFTSADGTTKLSHEIESWNDTPGKLASWVKVPNLS
ncbi:MAG: S8 family peptidase, partial [Nitrosopumilaceae archaeon]